MTRTTTTAENTRSLAWLEERGRQMAQTAPPLTDEQVRAAARLYLDTKTPPDRVDEPA